MSPTGRPEGEYLSAQHEGGPSVPIAILGGTFDPVHYGHLRVADEVRRALRLPEVRLVPARDPPHRSGPQASAGARRAMLECAVTAFPGLVVDDRELRRPGKSYTVLTLSEFRAEFPDRPLLLLLGADAFRGLPTWHRWREIFGLAHIVVVARPGTALADDLPAPLRAEWEARAIADPTLLRNAPAGLIYEQPVTPQPVSATDVRAAMAGDQAAKSAVATLLPPCVMAYIENHHLYQPAPDGT